MAASLASCLIFGYLHIKMISKWNYNNRKWLYTVIYFFANKNLQIDYAIIDACAVKCAEQIVENDNQGK